MNSSTLRCLAALAFVLTMAGCDNQQVVQIIMPEQDGPEPAVVELPIEAVADDNRATEEGFYDLKAGISRNKSVIVGVGVIESLEYPGVCLAADYRGRAASNLFRSALVTGDTYIISRLVNGVNLRRCPTAQQERSIAKPTVLAARTTTGQSLPQSEFFDASWWTNRTIVLGGKSRPGDRLATVKNDEPYSADAFNSGFQWIFSDDGVIHNKILSAGNIRLSDVTTGQLQESDGFPLTALNTFYKNIEEGRIYRMCLKRQGITHGYCEPGAPEDVLERWFPLKNGEIRRVSQAGTILNECLTATSRSSMGVERCDGSKSQRWKTPIIPAKPIVSRVFSDGSGKLNGCLFYDKFGEVIVSECDPGSQDARLNFIIDSKGALRTSLDYGSCFIPESLSDGSKLVVLGNDGRIKQKNVESTFVQSRTCATQGWRLTPYGQLFWSETAGNGETFCLSTPTASSLNSGALNNKAVVVACDVDAVHQKWLFSDAPNFSLATGDQLRGESEITDARFKILSNVRSRSSAPTRESVVGLQYRECLGNRNVRFGDFCLEAGSDWVLTPESQLQSILTGECLSVDADVSSAARPAVGRIGFSEGEHASLSLNVELRSCEAASRWTYTSAGEFRPQDFMSDRCLTEIGDGSLKVQPCQKFKNVSSREKFKQRFALSPSSSESSAKIHDTAAEKVVRFVTADNRCLVGRRVDQGGVVPVIGRCEDSSSFNSWLLSGDGRIAVLDFSLTPYYLAVSDFVNATGFVSLVRSRSEASEWSLGLGGSIRSYAAGRRFREERGSNGPGCLKIKSTRGGSIFITGDFQDVVFGECVQTGREGVLEPTMAVRAELVSGGSFTSGTRDGVGLLLQATQLNEPARYVANPLAVLSFVQSLGFGIQSFGGYTGLSDVQRQTLQAELGLGDRELRRLSNGQWKDVLSGRLEGRSHVNYAGTLGGLNGGLESVDEALGVQTILAESGNLVSARVFEESASSSLVVTPNGIGLEANAGFAFVEIQTPIGSFAVSSEASASASGELRPYNVGGVPVVVPFGSVSAESAVLAASFESDNAQVNAALLEAAVEAGVGPSSIRGSAGASLASGSVSIGSDTGTQVGVGGGAGLGLGGGLSFGENGRYGATFDVKLVTLDLYFDPRQVVGQDIFIAGGKAGATFMFETTAQLAQLAANEFGKDALAAAESAVRDALDRAADVLGTVSSWF